MIETKQEELCPNIRIEKALLTHPVSRCTRSQLKYCDNGKAVASSQMRTLRSFGQHDAAHLIKYIRKKENDQKFRT